MKIWKFSMSLQFEPQRIDAPGPITIRHFGIQDTKLTIWAEVDPGAPMKGIALQVVGTGSNVPPHWDYRGTLQDGCFVWHLYEDPIPF